MIISCSNNNKEKARHIKRVAYKQTKPETYKWLKISIAEIPKSSFGDMTSLPLFGLSSCFWYDTSCRRSEEDLISIFEQTHTSLVFA